MGTKRTFTEGKIFSPLISFAFPVLIALFLQAMYGAVDLWVVGKFGSAADVSAVATGGQVTYTVTVVIVGLSMGITVLIGQKIGEGREKEAGQVIGSGICMFLLISIALTAAMLLSAEPLAHLMQAPEAALSQTVDYLRICFAGTAFIVAYNVLGSVFRGIGDSKMPLITVAIACVFNIIGDLIFVAVFHMGTQGAALATVMAQAFSVLLSIFIIRRQMLPFSLRKKDLRPEKKHIQKILSLGAPVAFQDLLVNISFLVIMAIVNSTGVIASAGVGVAEKLCVFIMLVPSAYMQSMAAFVAQNVGAKRLDRAGKALLYGILSSLVVGLFMAYLSFFHGSALSTLFVKENDTAVIMAASDYLRAYSIDCILTSFLFCFIGYFNGRGKTLFVMIQGIVGAFGVRIPVSYLMTLTDGASLFHIGLATPASSVVQILLCVGYFLLLKRRQKKFLLENSAE